MKRETIYTRAMTLGPFLTLILLASSRRAAAECNGAIAAQIAARPASRNEADGDVRLPAKSILAVPEAIGPFLTLILNSSGSHSHSAPPLRGRG